ncbi:type III-B CRISPR module RAMP protein Cmr6 [Sulfurimonas sp. NWX367]|uniref:type III-B CRISPR module RAMP protein Cmr6 n=1 Tax=unclassified Sulfurimonas TaxID=2623549 RepID=UPI003204ABDE
MGANIGWLFYKEYFKDINYADISDAKNESLIQQKVDNIIKQKPELESKDFLGNIHFTATTTYPGLLLGSGNAHELPSIKGQAILGFSFDYTTGLPVIAGSSVKGVLRSIFKHKEYIQELLEDKTVDIEALEREIFTNGDIFFDATVSKSGRNLLGDDFLTPHDENGLKNPIPLRFIKVMPGVTFTFEFKLKDGIITKEQKALLFANILADRGIGAKTNVGYGQFEANLAQKAKNQIQDYQEELKKQELERKEKEEQLQKEAALSALDSNVEKIKVSIANYTKSDTKLIFETIELYELAVDEKNELADFLESHIGPKPTPKNKAPIKWAIKVYELLGR